jgi:hypothetical protein
LTRMGWGAAALLLVAGCAQAAAPPPPAPAASFRSGQYEALVLGVDPSGRVTGSFRMEQGEGVTKVCAFSFTGRAQGASAAVRVQGRPRGAAPALAGRLEATADGVTLRLPGADALPGCGLVLGPMIEGADGLELSRTGPGTWRELAEVKAARAPLRPAPGGPAGRAYVVAGDVVGVLERRGAAVRVVYPSDRARPSQGWVAAAELAPLTP